MYIQIGSIFGVIIFIVGVVLLFYNKGKVLRDDIFENTLLEKGLDMIYDGPEYDDNLFTIGMGVMLIIIIYIITLAIVSALTVLIYPFILLGLLFTYLIKKRIKQRKQF